MSVDHLRVICFNATPTIAHGNDVTAVRAITCAYETEIFLPSLSLDSPPLEPNVETFGLFYNIQYTRCVPSNERVAGQCC